MIKKKTEKADGGNLGGMEGAEELTAASSASGWEMFKESIPKKISTADVFGNQNRLPSKSSRQLEAPGTNPLETAGEEDTLMGRLAKRMAARDYIDKQNLGMGTKAQKAATADCGKKEVADNTLQDVMRNAPGKMNLGGYDPEQVKKGIAVEKEHNQTISKIKSGTSEDPKELIAKDHLRELPDYYDKLEKMEKQSMEDNHLIKEKFEQEQVTPDYWDKIQRIKGRELDFSGIAAQLKNRANATEGALGDDYSDPAKTELVMPGSNMADQAKNTGRVIGRGLENLRQHL